MVFPRRWEPWTKRSDVQIEAAGIFFFRILGYLEHHLQLAGVKTNLFEDAAITAIHQGSGGLLRKANHLARGSLIAAAAEEAITVTAEHVRLAATEIF